MIPFLLLTKLLHLFATLLETLFVSPTATSSMTCEREDDDLFWSSSHHGITSGGGGVKGGGNDAAAPSDPALLRRACDLFEIRDDGRSRNSRPHDPGGGGDGGDGSPTTSANNVLTTSTMTRGDIRERWRKLATMHHPDRNGGRIEAVDAMKIVDECYDVLSSEIDRRDHRRVTKEKMGGSLGDAGGAGNGGSADSNEGDARDEGCCCAGGSPQNQKQHQPRRRGKKDSPLSSKNGGGDGRGPQRPQPQQQQKQQQTQPQQQRQQKQRRKGQRNNRSRDASGGGGNSNSNKANKQSQNGGRTGTTAPGGPPVTEERRRMERELRREWDESNRRTRSFRREMLRRLARECRDAAKDCELHTLEGRDRAHHLWEEATSMAAGCVGMEGSTATGRKDTVERGEEQELEVVAGHHVDGWDDPSVVTVMEVVLPTKPVHPVMEYCPDPVAIALRMDMTDVAVNLIQEDLNRAAAAAASGSSHVQPVNPSLPVSSSGGGGGGAAEDLMMPGEDPLLDYLGGAAASSAAAASTSGVDGAVSCYLLRPMDDDGNTLMHYAVYHENVDVIDLVARTARQYGGGGAPVGVGVGGGGGNHRDGGRKSSRVRDGGRHHNHRDHGTFVRVILARNDRGQIPSDFARCCLRADSTDMPARVARLTSEAESERDDSLLIPTAIKTARRVWNVVKGCGLGPTVHTASLYLIGTRWFECSRLCSVVITAAARGVSRMEELGLRLDITRGGGGGGVGGGDHASSEHAGAGRGEKKPPSPSSSSGGGVGAERHDGDDGRDDGRDDDDRHHRCDCDRCSDRGVGGGRSIVLALYLTLHLTWWATHGAWSALARFVRWEAFAVAAPLACACCCCTTTTSVPPPPKHSSSGTGGGSGGGKTGPVGGGQQTEDYDDGLDLIDVALLVPTSILYLGLNCIHVLATVEERIILACEDAGGMARRGLTLPLLFLFGGRRAWGTTVSSSPVVPPVPPAVAAGLERIVVLVAFAVWFVGFKYVVAAVRRNLCVPLRMFWSPSSSSPDDCGGGGVDISAVGSSF